MDMLGEVGRERAWSQIYSLFIEPALEKRSDIAWENVHKVLIRLPTDKEPIVQFNNEFQFVYAVEDPVARNMGDVLQYHDFRDIKEVLPPKVNDIYVAFVYAWRATDRVFFAFDCRPNYPDFDEEKYELGAGLQYRLKCEALELILVPVVNSKERLLEIGLSIFPALVPFPLNAIVKHLLDGEKSEAYDVLEDHCVPNFIKEHMASWYSLQLFEDRRELFEEALRTHSMGLYHVTIIALISQIEGIITDWLYRNSEAKTPWRAASKFKEFQRLLESVIPVETVEAVILQSVSRFLVSPETILQKFYDWNSSVLNIDSVSRNVSLHGKYVPEYYTKANSIKMFLVIDSISWCIQCYESYRDHIHTELV